MEERVRTMSLLLKTYPSLKLPWMSLGKFPTPAHRLEAIGRDWSHPNLWIKRDDLSAELYSSTKVRKLEYIIADAKAKNATSMIVFGGAGSNQVVSNAIYGKVYGFKVTGVIFPQPFTELVWENIQRNMNYGAELVFIPHAALLPFKVLSIFLRHRLQGKRPYIIAPGASSKLGTVGCVEGILELKGQIERGELPEPDYIIAPLGSCGTVAGLVAGVKLFGLKSRVVAIRVVDKIISNKRHVCHLANGSLKLMKENGFPGHFPEITPNDFDLKEEHFGGEYGKYTVEGLQVMKAFHELENISLDGVYTAKTAAGLRAVAHTAQREKCLLFWHTASTPSPPKPVTAEEIVKLPKQLRAYLGITYSISPQ